MTEPRTVAGRDLLNNWDVDELDLISLVAQMRTRVRAIEAEAAALDVEVVRGALASEDEIAHGEAVVERDGKYVRLGQCAYCDGEWPCRTQRGINRLLARLIAERKP